jgi:antitoxin HicB
VSAPAFGPLRIDLTPDEAGGWVVTSPDVPELATEGDTLAEALANAGDALAAVRELYADSGRPAPPWLR